MGIGSEKRRIELKLGCLRKILLRFIVPVFPPKYGIADIRFVMTVAPQKDICPHGRTYPTNAVTITKRRRTIPVFHV